MRPGIIKDYGPFKGIRSPARILGYDKTHKLRNKGGLLRYSENAGRQFQTKEYEHRGEQLSGRDLIAIQYGHSA